MRALPFSEKQMRVLCWWGGNSPHREKTAVICDGAEDATLYVPYFAKIGGSTSSRTAKTSSCVANAISMSSW